MKEISIRFSDYQQAVSMSVEQAELRLRRLVGHVPSNQSILAATQILDQAPETLAVRLILCKLYYQDGNFQALEEISGQGLYHHPLDEGLLQAHTLALRYRHAHGQACEILAGALEEAPGAVALRHQLGLLKKEQGRLMEAREIFDDCIKKHRNFTEAYWSRADISADIPVAELREMEQLTELEHNALGRAQLCYALGRGWEWYGETKQSFHWYSQGAAARRTLFRHEAGQELRRLQQLSVKLSAQHFDTGCPTKPDWAARLPVPVFICGFPRSGTSMLERLLAGHSQITPLGETLELARASQSVLKEAGISKEYPDWLPLLNEQQWQHIGEHYLQRITSRCSSGLCIDKMPANYKAIALIKKALPHARILHTVREPIATIWGCFKQLFADGQAFTYDLDELTDTYLAYQHLMRFWHQHLPGQILDVSLAELTQSTEQQLRKVLDHLSLPFEQTCVDLKGNRAVVATQSAAQLQEGIEERYIQGWRAFEPYLHGVSQRLSDWQGADSL
ncbi:tetratricopeptide repeat-containing sulfotransferase family protein [Bowmanella dokdonensis]|uniref:Sulfotransferase n=1 Tax=Bowmanella dokdonensis TaxID=751969 RepID=A0A939IPQ3_9ALTE|nr:sulfotransferase [Bowmanella dokdonensis]MBN7824234.1 sulfotransferase [Bowmanella dokdonensis]